MDTRLTSIVHSSEDSQGVAGTKEKRNPAGPVIVLERRSCDVALPTVELRRSSQLSLSMSDRVPSASQAPTTSTKNDIEHVEVEKEASVIEDVVIFDKPTEKIFFLKRMEEGRPHFDVLVEVGQGQMRLNAKQAEIEYAIWEANEDLFIYRQAGPDIRILQSLGSVEYRGANDDKYVKHKFSIKTCGFIGHRDANRQLNIMMLAVSGKSFLPHREADKKDFLHHCKWHKRVKNMARHLNLNLRTFYDGAGKPMTAENCGDWRAGHVEKKLATHVAYAMLNFYDIQPSKKNDVSLRDLDQLRQQLRSKGLTPRFEIHLSRGPCGTSTRPGQCIPFENNVILDGSVPPKPKARPVNEELSALHHQANLAGPSLDYDSEEEDLRIHLAEAEGRGDDIVYDGFEPVEDEPCTYNARATDDHNTADTTSSPLPQLHVPAEVAAKFGENLRQKFTRKEKPAADSIDTSTETAKTTESMEEIERELFHIELHRAPSQSQYWEEPAPSTHQGQTRTPRADNTKQRRARKIEKRKERAAAAKMEKKRARASKKTEGSAIAVRLGALLNSSNRIG
ncbi:hypothetical protein CORC01_01105 [Colletotrichum orchidophilum]|uniref:Uncharacterized protein n=1 Tax=Colletotrichum orchidophilum TaxID=1209926 RepID=A0A1G4BR66_9PEZI|nr:uncharacterized protein CORC01_01105 [Colletotrichum orchidophilum]OHF03786.1 hypothetical protein CORC01_01105 [Colletotrichum orchidophilum]